MIHTSLTNTKYAFDLSYYVIIRSIFLFFVWLGRLVGWIPPFPNRQISDVEKYEKKMKPAFLKYYDTSAVVAAKDLSEMNCNVSPIFYDRTKLKEYMKIENNDIEKQWKTRILVEYTPRGNIIMFYDAYKGGFSYYSDQSVIPLTILNCVAMKYVTKYMCLDFFVDEGIVFNNPSPLIKLLEEEDKEELDKKKRVLKTLEMTTCVKLPYVKLKSAKTPQQQQETPANEKEKRMNKFIYLGKVNNFSFIQKKRFVSLHNPDDCEKLFKNVNYEEYKRNVKNKTA